MSEEQAHDHAERAVEQAPEAAASNCFADALDALHEIATQKQNYAASDRVEAAGIVLSYGLTVSEIAQAKSDSDAAALEGAYENGYDAGFESGFESGRESGYDAGFESGRESSYDDGYMDGYEKGVKDGKKNARKAKKR